MTNLETFFAQQYSDLLDISQTKTLMITFSPGTYSSSEQEILLPWLNYLHKQKTLYNRDFFKIFYLIDSEYIYQDGISDITVEILSNLNLKNTRAKEDKLKFHLTSLKGNIFMYHNDKYNIYFYQIPYNLPTEYKDHLRNIHQTSVALKYNKTLKKYENILGFAPSFKCIPNQYKKFWSCIYKIFLLCISSKSSSTSDFILLKKLICDNTSYTHQEIQKIRDIVIKDIFPLSDKPHTKGILMINNCALFNSRFFLNHRGKTVPIAQTTGLFFEYFGELGFILKLLLERTESHDNILMYHRTKWNKFIDEHNVLSSTIEPEKILWKPSCTKLKHKSDDKITLKKKKKKKIKIKKNK